jgi:hypothetical protein
MHIRHQHTLHSIDACVADRALSGRFIVRDTIEEGVEMLRRKKLAAAGGEDAVLGSVKKSQVSPFPAAVLHFITP